MDATNDWASAPVTGRRTTAVSYVLADLRSAIASEVFRVGDRLPSEAALAARYSVSRPVIREVLRVLESTGLTLTRTGRGTFVVAAQPDELIFDEFSAGHLLEARPGVEIPAATLAALRRTDAQIEELQDLMERMESESDISVWTRLDSALHLAIARASGNPVFATVMASIASALSRQSELLNAQASRRAASEAEHRAIVSAIARGSALEAEDAMRCHLDEVRDAIAVALTVKNQLRRETN